MLQSDLAQVKSALAASVAGEGVLGEATAFHLASGGKAWRARLALDCGQALDLGRPDRIGLALTCELIHQASVVHDDIQDKATTRRGRSSVAARFGPAIALCVGDHLLMSAFGQLSALSENAALARLFGGAVSQMAAAQAEEFGPALWTTMTWPRYVSLIEGKAGAMLVLPVAGAAVLAGLPATDVDLACRAARILGVAYQAGDDVADLAADLAQGALNGVIARGLDHCGEIKRAQWQERLAQARRSRLSEAEAGFWAATLNSQAEAVTAWRRALLADASAALQLGASPGCRALIPLIDAAARQLAACNFPSKAKNHAA